MRVAFTTFAVLKNPYPHPDNDDFNELEPLVFGASGTSAGFVARAEAVGGARTRWTNFGRDYGEWGAFHAPAFYTGGRTDETDARASTLSLWTDLESVQAYAYSGIHLHALRNRGKWFVRIPHRLYAAWWVADDAVPTWREACERLEHLDEHGSTPYAFDFRDAFDADGRSYGLRRPGGQPVAGTA
ncbi:DUF3291 domain-containing protein [Streptomyces montanisoli]|uniref:DUF3291 domain-containing protein n=1 Tax=Streptomyces montanisoli TaxID=2798581 RepID=A0A940RXB3_9ACTN|nr:DUF3291 domain-containing protein [Streptomyces montanisoli]MBP0460146.1 DUF3291 domain-containing protein [Streptomyces montanisoli]